MEIARQILATKPYKKETDKVLERKKTKSFKTISNEIDCWMVERLKHKVICLFFSEFYFTIVHDTGNEFSRA